MWLLASCGQQYQAKSAVKDFVQQQLHKDVSYLSFSDVDSTRTVSDSLIGAMQQRAPRGVSYQSRTGRSLHYIRARYVDGQDTCSATFYLNPETGGVVAFKQN